MMPVGGTRRPRVEALRDGRSWRSWPVWPVLQGTARARGVRHELGADRALDRAPVRRRMDHAGAVDRRPVPGASRPAGAAGKLW